jgi:hypothetical protein
MANSESTPNARDVFDAAVAFERVAAHLLTVPIPPGAKGKTVTFRVPNAVIQQMAPAFMTAAFCAELYLKCLLRISGKPVPHTHNLSRIFRLLPAEFQADVERQYAATDGAPATAREAIENAVGAFEAYRYYFQSRHLLSPNKQISAKAIIISVRNVIWEQRPKWFPGGWNPNRHP